MQINPVIRVSPVQLPSKPIETGSEGDRQVVLRYHDEGNGPWLVDLSHVAKWDIQDSRLDALTPAGLQLPTTIGDAIIAGGVLVNRLNPTQAHIWDLAGTGVSLVEQPWATDITDGLCLLALFGRSSSAVMEKASSLDVHDPHRCTPYLLQGPVWHIPCQVVVLSSGAQATFLLGFSRGYGQSMVEALIQSGSDLGLQPAGMTRFYGQLNPLKGDGIPSNAC